MSIIEKITAKTNDLFGQPAVTLAFLGDSVTQGCFEVFCTADNTIDTVFESHNAYHAKLHSMLSMLYPKVPFHIINAGISGGTASNGVTRLERDVLRHSPDLCVVCFGLNDCCNRSENAINVYRDSLETIFTKLQTKGISVIFMTPNMMCSTVDASIAEPAIQAVAKDTADIQNSGRLETFLQEGIAVANRLNVPVCDCYAKWKRLANAGVNTDQLLSNKINHPTRDMHHLFAVSLLETILQEKP